jgi:hypothetical protein
VVWRAATVGEVSTTGLTRPIGLRGNAALAALTALACLVSAGAEGWRFSLLLRGRTWVLSGDLVRASDAFVDASGVTALLLGIVTAVWALPNLIALHRGSAMRNGWAPSRTGAGILARLVIPGWNVYGAGQIVAEVDGELAVAAAPRDPTAGVGPRPVARPRISALALIWWISWAIDAVLVVAVLVAAYWRSVQAMANTVEWHIALAVTGAVVSGVFAALLLRFARRWSGQVRNELDGWVVAPPPSSAMNLRTRPSSGTQASATGRLSELDVPDRALDSAEVAAGIGSQHQSDSVGDSLPRSVEVSDDTEGPTAPGDGRDDDALARTDS